MVAVDESVAVHRVSLRWKVTKVSVRQVNHLFRSVDSTNTAHRTRISTDSAVVIGTNDAP